MIGIEKESSNQIIIFKFILMLFQHILLFFLALNWRFALLDLLQKCLFLLRLLKSFSLQKLRIFNRLISTELQATKMSRVTCRQETNALSKYIALIKSNNWRKENENDVREIRSSTLFCLKPFRSWNCVIEQSGLLLRFNSYVSDAAIDY